MLFLIRVGKMAGTTVKKHGRCQSDGDFAFSSLSMCCLCVHFFILPLAFDGVSSPPWQLFMTCKVDTEAEIKADVPVTAVPPFLVDKQPPPPFQCRPGSAPAGYWDEATQKLIEDGNIANSRGRTEIEGCSFWGRGALLTRGSVSNNSCFFFVP